MKEEEEEEEEETRDKHTPYSRFPLYSPQSAAVQCVKGGVICRGASESKRRRRRRRRRIVEREKKWKKGRKGNELGGRRDKHSRVERDEKEGRERQEKRVTPHTHTHRRAQARQHAVLLGGLDSTVEPHTQTDITSRRQACLHRHRHHQPVASWLL